MAEVELPNLEELEEKKNKRFTRGVPVPVFAFSMVMAVAGGVFTLNGFYSSSSYRYCI
jgi:hypothetical protein